MVVHAAPPAGFRASVADTLPEVVRRIVEALDPEKLVLFGSYAYGTPTPDSDVDLFVVMNTTASRLERYLAVSRLLDPRPFPVDIIVRTPGEITDALTKGDIIIGEILSLGQVLYERSG